MWCRMMRNTTVRWVAETNWDADKKSTLETRALRVGNKGANVTEPRDEEGDCLDEKVDEVVVFPKGHVVASAEEEVEASAKFQQMDSAKIWRRMRSIKKILLPYRSGCVFCKSTTEFENLYLSPILKRGLLGALAPAFALRASPSFSVTTHSFTLPASRRPIKVAFVRCSDMTFSKRIQNTNKWSDLRDQSRVHDNHTLELIQFNIRR